MVPVVAKSRKKSWPVLPCWVQKPVEETKDHIIPDVFFQVKFVSVKLVGNAVNGVTLSIDRLYGEVRSHCNEVETLLSMGASPWEAVHELVREAIRAATTPTINALMVVGVVSLPGMMTGQILGGADPVEAARYQIVVMLMISCAAALGSMVLVGLSFRRLFTKGEALQPNLFRSDS